MKERRNLALVALLTLMLVAAAACNKAGSSPTATAKAFHEAVKAKDAQGMKNSMSKKSLEIMEKFAAMQNKSLDEALKDPSPLPPTFEARNEKITGDAATLEVKDEKGSWETIHFAKEDGQWKIAFDKSMQMDTGAGGGGGDHGGGH